MRLGRRRMPPAGLQTGLGIPVFCAPNTGTRSIQMLYRAIIFTFIPTFLELLFVCGVLAQAFSPLVGGLVIATFTVRKRGAPARLKEDG